MICSYFYINNTKHDIFLQNSIFRKTLKSLRLTKHKQRIKDRTQFKDLFVRGEIYGNKKKSDNAIISYDHQKIKKCDHSFEKMKNENESKTMEKKFKRVNFHNPTKEMEEKAKEYGINLTDPNVISLLEQLNDQAEHQHHQDENRETDSDTISAQTSKNGGNNRIVITLFILLSSLLQKFLNCLRYQRLSFFKLSIIIAFALVTLDYLT